MTRRQPSPQERLWRAVAGFGEARFTLRDLHGKLGTRSIDSLRGAVRRLAAEGQVREVGAEPGSGSTPAAKLFVCARPTAPFRQEGRGAGARQQQLWTAMRTLSAWSVPELAAAASTDEVAITASLASGYVSTLLKAGIVQVVRPRSSGIGTGSTAATYRLAPKANSGPLAPEVRRGRRVFDLNRRQWVGEAAAEQVAP